MLNDLTRRDLMLRYAAAPNSLSRSRRAWISSPWSVSRADLISPTCIRGSARTCSHRMGIASPAAIDLANAPGMTRSPSWSMLPNVEARPMNSPGSRPVVLMLNASDLWCIGSPFGDEIGIGSTGSSWPRFVLAVDPRNVSRAMRWRSMLAGT